LNGDDGILDSLARQAFPGDGERADGFKRAFRVAAIPIFCLFLFFGYYFVFIDPDWTVMSIVARIFMLSFITIFTLLLSPEPMEWRLISVSAVTVIIIIDSAAQLMNMYDYPTVPGGPLRYDFIGHIFTGILTIAFLTNVVRNAGRNMHWIVVLSIGIAFLWELTEYGISVVGETFIKGDIKAFSFDLENSMMDLIAHGIGVGIFIGFFASYKYLRCPPSFRSGLVCRVLLPPCYRLFLIKRNAMLRSYIKNASYRAC